MPGRVLKLCIDVNHAQDGFSQMLALYAVHNHALRSFAGVSETEISSDLELARTCPSEQATAVVGDFNQIFLTSLVYKLAELL